MKNKKIKMLLLAIVLSISCFLTCFVTTNVVYASSIGIVGGYTNVLEDLQKDDTFNAEDYPVIQDDYSLQVITIAESSDKELFVYVYQPSAEYKNLRASSIFISTNPKGLDYTNYYLTLISNQGVFYKYRVNNLFVSNQVSRDYEITSIYRPFDKSIDGSLDNNIINEVQFEVAKHWTFTTSDTGTLISFQDVETIKIVDKYVGFCRYEDGYSGFPGMGFSFHEPGKDSHFVAFKTDRKIDNLMEADVFYTTQEYSYIKTTLVEEENFEDKKDCYAYLKGEKVYVDIPNGGSGSKFEWETIQTIDEFFETEDREVIYEFGVFDVKKETKLTDEGKKDIEGMDWILRFALTDFNDYYSNVQNGSVLTRTHHINYSIVGDVSILRLRFVTDGVEYNLGVIDNKQQGDGTPDNYTKTTITLSNEFKIIMSILFLIILVVVLSPILPTIFNVLWAIIKYIFKALWWLISAPFKLIGKVFKKRE